MVGPGCRGGRAQCPGVITFPDPFLAFYVSREGYFFRLTFMSSTNKCTGIEVAKKKSFDFSTKIGNHFPHSHKLLGAERKRKQIKKLNT